MMGGMLGGMPSGKGIKLSSSCKAAGTCWKVRKEREEKRYVQVEKVSLCVCVCVCVCVCNLPRHPLIPTHTHSYPLIPTVLTDIR